jgi:hypothetical protein
MLRSLKWKNYGTALASKCIFGFWLETFEIMSKVSPLSWPQFLDHILMGA